MNLFAILTLGLFLAPQPDMAAPGFKKVVQEVAIENPNDFDGWRIVAAMFLGPSHVTTVQPNVPFRYSSKYPTRIYAIPNGTSVPLQVSGKRVPMEAFESFLSTAIPVSLPSSVSMLSPVKRNLTTMRIVNFSEGTMQLQTVREQEFDGDGESVGWLRVWGIPVGAVILGILGLVFLRRRRLQRALG